MNLKSEQSLTHRPGRFLIHAAATFGALALIATSELPTAQAADPVMPPFPPGLFYPVDGGSSPTFPGATLVPRAPVFDFAGIPGWIDGKKITNAMGVTIPKYEMLVIRGSKIDGKSIVIPPGGLYFDASPARGELPMTGASDFFLGKRYYFVDYDARIQVRQNLLVAPKKFTVVGNHLYTLLLPPVPKVVPDPVVNWRTFDGVSIRPWALSERWEKSDAAHPDQRPLTYLQGVIRSTDKTGVTFASLTGTSIRSEWWAKRRIFEGWAKAGQKIVHGGTGIVVKSVDPDKKTVTIVFLEHGKTGKTHVLKAQNSPTLPENPSIRKRMVAIDGRTAVVLWPHDALGANGVRLWVYGGVSQWKTNSDPFGIAHVAYFPIACPIAHHIGGMIYNTRPIRISPGKPASLFGGYATLKVVSVSGHTVKFRLTTSSGSTPVFVKRGNIDAVLGKGRAAHGILSSLDTTDLSIDRDLSVTK